MQLINVDAAEYNNRAMLDFGCCASSGGVVFGVVGRFVTVVEFGSFDDFWQLVSAFETQPFLCCGLTEVLDHQLRGLL